MLITIHLQDKKAYLYRLFRSLWKQAFVECGICLERVHDDGVVIVSDYATLNLEKMFHAACLKKWWKQSGKYKDPFNRTVKYTFNFPPKSFEECSSMLDIIKGFIGDENTDKLYSIEYQRVKDQNSIDVYFDLDDLFNYD